MAEGGGKPDPQLTVPHQITWQVCGNQGESDTGSRTEKRESPTRDEMEATTLPAER